MTVSVGLVGYGLAGQVFHSPLFKAAGVNFVAVASSNPQRVQADYPGVTVHASPQALFADETVDLVVLATPSHTHATLLEQALSAGKHVISDKPFTATVAEADRVIEAAKRSGQIATCFHNRRWDSDFLTIRKLIEDGVLGDIKQYRAHFEFYRPVETVEEWREQPGPAVGVHYDLGAHLIDQALTLFGMPDWVSGDVVVQRSGSLVPDSFHARLGYQHNDLRVDLYGSLCPPDHSERFSVHGTRGSYVKRFLDIQESQLRAGMCATAEGYGIEPESHWGRLTTVAGDQLQESVYPTLPGTHYEIYRQTAMAIENNTTPPVTMEQARDTIRVIEALVQSSDSASRIAF